MPPRKKPKKRDSVGPGQPLLDLAAIEAADPAALVAYREFWDSDYCGKATLEDFFNLVKLQGERTKVISHCQSRTSGYRPEK